jgi:gluconate 2-dehydrogenase gamma chain
MTVHSDGGLSMSRREALSALAALPAAALLDRRTITHRARDYFARVDREAPGTVPRFFTAHEWRTVRLLADYIIPRDERSGSATDAGVPEFVDFMMIDQPALQTPIRGGLHWLDTASRDRFGAAFADCRPLERTQMLDAIAWPHQSRPDTSQGVEFFSRFRDLTASGFWTSPMGIADLQYLGNTVVHEWTGCPQAALDKLGVSY